MSFSIRNRIDFASTGQRAARAFDRYTFQYPQSDRLRFNSRLEIIDDDFVLLSVSAIGSTSLQLDIWYIIIIMITSFSIRNRIDFASTITPLFRR